MIRDGVPEDFKSIIDCCEKFWAHTIHDETFHRDHALCAIRLAYEHELLAVVDIDGVVGFMACVSSYLLASKEALVATELAWWLDEDQRGNGVGIELMNYMESKGRGKGIKYWNMVAMQSSMPEAVEKMYLDNGYVKNETIYMKVL